jgi:hypothetical protein
MASLFHCPLDDLATAFYILPDTMNRVAGGKVHTQAKRGEKGCQLSHDLSCV